MLMAGDFGDPGASCAFEAEEAVAAAATSRRKSAF